MRGCPADMSLVAEAFVSQIAGSTRGRGQRVGGGAGQVRGATWDIGLEKLQPLWSWMLNLGPGMEATTEY